jgi:ferric-dicitrate binding protein FerR (iron transport regulator)
MNMEQSTQQLIDKFWAGTATDSEKRQLTDALDAPTADWQAELRRAFDQQDSARGPMTAGQSARVLMRLHRQIVGERDTNPRFTIWHQWGRWAAAAVLLLLAGLGVWFYTRSGSPEPVLAQQKPASHWQLTHRTNATTTPQRMSLADGSTLTLQPGSSVSYYEPFGKSSRDISMSGDVLYVVAKDPAHPFTVLAGGITTTALGTQFRVQTTARHRVAVRLLEGRVVVRATPASGLTMSDTYLKPGQELNVDTRSARVSVAAFHARPSAAPPGPRLVVPPVRAEVPGLAFAKEPLETVLQRVSQRYNVPIDFDPADVQGLSFSGSFARGDSLRIVLKAVCLTNNLSFTQEAARVTVRRLP